MSLRVLPSELITDIAKFLPLSDFLQLMTINKNWFQLLNSDEMWQERIPNLHSQLSLHRNLLKRESKAPEHNIRDELMKIKKEISECIDNLYNLKPFENIEKLNKTWSSIKPARNEFDKFCESFKIEEHLKVLKKEPIKCCIVGAGVIGRTRMCYQMHFGNQDDNSEIEKHLNRWQDYHDVYDCEELVRPLYKLILVDTPGPENDANNMRPLYYEFPQKCQMFIVCYSIASPIKMVQDLEYISRKLIPEIQPFLNLTRSVLLVGTQSDICHVQKENERLGRYWNRYLVGKYDEFGKGLSEQIGAAVYVSTSSFEFIGIEELEDLMIKAFVYSKLVEEKKKEKKCLIC